MAELYEKPDTESPKNVQLYAPPSEERGKSIKSLKELGGEGPKLGGLGIGEAPSGVSGRPLPPLPTEAASPTKAQSQEEYFEELARQAQAGRSQTDSLVKVQPAVQNPNNPTQAQREELAARAMQNMGKPAGGAEPKKAGTMPTPEQRAALAQAALAGNKPAASSSGGSSGGTFKNAPSAEERQRLAQMAMAGNSAAAPPPSQSKFKDGPTPEQRAALAAKALGQDQSYFDDLAAQAQASRNEPVSMAKVEKPVSNPNAPSAADRQKLAEMAMQGNSSASTQSSVRKAPTAEQRAQLAAMAQATAKGSSSSGLARPSDADKKKLLEQAMGSH